MVTWRTNHHKPAANVHFGLSHSLCYRFTHSLLGGQAGWTSSKYTPLLHTPRPSNNSTCIVSVVLCGNPSLCVNWSGRVANGTQFYFQGHGARCECRHVWGAYSSVYCYSRESAFPQRDSPWDNLLCAHDVVLFDYYIRACMLFSVCSCILYAHIGRIRYMNFGLRTLDFGLSPWPRG